jgi:hypothetical protein
MKVISSLIRMLFVTTALHNGAQTESESVRRKHVRRWLLRVRYGNGKDGSNAVECGAEREHERYGAQFAVFP